jgi:hypothetical protein
MGVKMSIENLSAQQGQHAAYTVAEFCQAYRISRSKLYQLWDADIGPRVLKIGAKILITIDAARDWQRERETASNVEAA